MKIQILHIFKESFKDVWSHKLEWIRVAYAPFVIWAFGVIFMGLMYWLAVGSVGFFEIISGKTTSFFEFTLTRDIYLIGLGNVVYSITSLSAFLSITVNGYRYGVLQDRGDRWWTLNLNWRFIKMALYYLLIIILTGIYGLIAAGIVIGAQILLDIIPLTVILGLLFLLGGIYLIVRIALTFLLIAIDREKPLRTSWLLLKRNILRLCGLMLLLGVALLLIGGIGFAITAAIGIIADMMSSSFLVGLFAILIVLLGGVMWILAWAVNAKALALVYKTFTEGKAF